MSKAFFENLGRTILGLALLPVIVYVTFIVGGFLANCFSVEPDSFFGTILMGVCATPLIGLYTFTWNDPSKVRKCLLLFSCWLCLLLSWGTITLLEKYMQWIGYEKNSAYPPFGTPSIIALMAILAYGLFCKVDETRKNPAALKQPWFTPKSDKTKMPFYIFVVLYLGIMFYYRQIGIVVSSSSWETFCRFLGVEKSGFLGDFLSGMLFLFLPVVILARIGEYIGKKFHLRPDDSETPLLKTNSNEKQTETGEP